MITGGRPILEVNLLSDRSAFSRPTEEDLNFFGRKKIPLWKKRGGFMRQTEFSRT